MIGPDGEGDIRVLVAIESTKGWEQMMAVKSYSLLDRWNALSSFISRDGSFWAICVLLLQPKIK